MIIDEYVKKIEGIFNTKDLNEIERELRDPFGDTDFESDPAYRPVFDALARQEQVAKNREAEGNAAIRFSDLKSIKEAMDGIDTKGSGVVLKGRSRGGKRVPMRGSGRDVPASGSGDSDDNNPFRAGFNLFKKNFIYDNLSEGYYGANKHDGSNSHQKIKSGEDLVDKEGVIPADAWDAGMKQFLLAMAAEGVLGPEEITKYAADQGIAKSTASQARGVARKRARTDAGPSQSQAQNTLKKSIKADVLKDADAKMKSLYEMGFQKGRTMGHLEGKRDAGAFVNAVQGDGLAGMPQDGSGGGGNGGSGGGNGGGSGAGDGDGDNDKPTTDEKQKVRDENRQHRDEAWYARDQKREAKEEQKHVDFAKKTLAGAEEQERKSTEVAQKKGGKGGAAMNGFEPFMAARLFDNFSASVRAGLQVGNAAGAIASGIEHMVLGAAGGFVRAGESALGLFLSPFGRTGGSLARMAGAIGGAIISGLTAGGGLAVAGIKLGVGLVSGLIAGVQSLAGAGIGAVLGAAGGPAGMLAGAVIGSGLVARIQSVFSGLLTTIGGAVGQAFASIGTAFGELGTAVGSFLSSVKDVLSDLIETGVKLGQTALSTQRNSGMSGQASSDAVGLSQVLTGGSGAFNGMFSNVAMMTPYMKARDTAYGVNAGNSFVDNLPGLFKRYQAFGDGPAGALQRRIMLSIVAPGAQDTVGGLFSLGGGVVQKAVQTAKAVALTPAENRQNAMLGFDLNAVQAQLDRLKTRLLTDLMPALNGILGVFTKWFTGHEGAIVGSLEKFGRWIYVMLPEYFRQGANAFLKMGMAIGDALPGIALFIDKFYFGFATLFNSLQMGLGALMVGIAPIVALMPGVGPTASAALFKQGTSMVASPGMNPNALDGMFNDKDGVFGKNGALNGDNIKKWSKDHKYGFDQDFEKNEGSIATRNKAYDGFSQYFQNNQSGRTTVDVNLKADITTRPDEESHARFVQHVGDQTIKRLVRADQRS